MKAVLLTLGTFLDNESGTWAVSYGRLAKGAGVARETAIRRVKQAEDEGWLKKTKRRAKGQLNDVNQYQVIIPEGSDVRSLGGDVRSPGGDLETPEVVTSDHPHSVSTLSSFKNSLADRPKADPGLRDDFYWAVARKDTDALLTLVGNQFYGFGPVTAEKVVALPDTIVSRLEEVGKREAADVVGANGYEIDIVADGLRDLIRKGYDGQFHSRVLMAFIYSAAEVKVLKGKRPLNPCFRR